jgi:class 3 adenylate cyclase
MKRRPPFSAALVALVVLVTGVTGAMLGGLAWREKRAGARALTGTAMRQVAALTAEHVVRFFDEAEPAARLGPLLAAQSVLDPGDLGGLERYLLSVLRAHPDLTWASYGDRDDRFVGAWRDPAGQVFVNRSFPRGGRIRLEEDRVQPDGTRARVRTVDDHDYRPRERPYFRLAEARRVVAWTEPYRFFGAGMGMTCVAPLLDGAGRVRGAFTADYSLERLARLLAELRVTPRSRVYLTTAGGAAVAGSPPVGEAAAGDESRRLTGILQAVEAGQPPLDPSGEPLLGHAARFSVAGHEWRVLVLVPERDLTAQIDAQARQAAALGGLALLLAAGGGIALSRWIARPLRALGAQAERIRVGDLDVSIVPDSRDEIGTLARTMAGMVQGLRDRDFIRDVLGRYVSPELADQCLRDREAFRLGGELRTVSILMSDLRGFSALSERLGPEPMIGLLNRYLAHMVPVILEHRGTINEFIGDAILVLFGAPVERPDDAARAIRCAWAMQRAMREFNAVSQARGLPELVMGIGLHTGRVVAGNIGSADRVKYGVVGPPVNIAGRIESLTVGPQILLSQALLDRAPAVARVGPPREAAFKGVADAVTVYELLGVEGEAPPPARLPAPGVAVDLSADCYRVEGKQVVAQPGRVRVTRLGLDAVRFEADPAFAKGLLDVKLVVDFGAGSRSPGSYARVAARESAPSGEAVEAVFTALDEDDRRHIAARLAGGRDGR